MIAVLDVGNYIVGTGKMRQEATVVVSCGLAVKCIDQGWIRDEGLILQPPKQDKENNT